MKHVPKLFFISVIVLVGVLFRLWFITLAPQPFIYDQQEYEYYAGKMNSYPYWLASHTYRPYPFPLLLVTLYRFVGWGNHQAVYEVNAIMDSLVIVMVGSMVYQGTKRKKLAVLAGFLYMFNPFTSGYVGVVLSEILATFFIAASFWVGMAYVGKPTLFKGLVFGFLVGMVAETRTAAFAWAVIPLLIAVYYAWKKRAWISYLFVLLGLCISVLYPLYVNWRDYHQITITTVDSITAREFYNGAILKILPPFTTSYPVPVMQMYWEYYSEYYPNRTRAEREAMKQKYWNMGWDIVKKDPIDYIGNRFFKMWYVWQKENIFFYTEPGFLSHRWITYAINVFLLIMSILGMVVGLRISKRSNWRFLMMGIIGTCLYGTLAFSITHAEYRLTIPFYPLLIIVATVGLIYGAEACKDFLWRKNIQRHTTKQ